ncbi:hypothetical protein [Palleronia aestuarii]|nr:hypothetical protein [Palleronia aestuarii]
MNVAPIEVTIDHAQAFHQALEINKIGKDPYVALRAAVDGWNLATLRISG